MHNIEIRNEMRKAGVFGYEVASELKVSETSFSRALSRSELNDDKKAHIIKIIKTMNEQKIMLSRAYPKNQHVFH